MYVDQKNYIDNINYLKKEYLCYKHNYNIRWKTNNYDYYDLYVELSSTQAKCQFCKFYWYKGSENEAS